MKKIICTDQSVAKKLLEFFNSHQIVIEIVGSGPGDLVIEKCDERKQSDLNVIYSGGWITCEFARSVTKKINISLPQMGKLLNHIDVKVRKCSLGCFK